MPRCTSLASANLLRTGLGVPQAQALVEAVKAHPTLKSVCGLRGDESVVDMSGKSLGAEDMVLLAGELKAMESMTELDLTESRFGEAGTSAIVGVLPECEQLTTLRISGQEGEESDFIKKKHCTGSSFEEGDIVQYKGQACKVTKGVDSDGDLQVRPLGAVVTMEASMTELDLSGKKLGPDVAEVLVAFLPRCERLTALKFSGKEGEETDYIKKKRCTGSSFGRRRMQISKRRGGSNSKSIVPKSTRRTISARQKLA